MTEEYRKPKETLESETNRRAFLKTGAVAAGAGSSHKGISRKRRG